MWGVIRADKVGLNEGQFKNFTDLNNKPFDLIGLNIEPYSPIIDDADTTDNILESDNKAVNNIMSDSTFSHLHVHSQFSILTGTIDIDDLVNKAVEFGMPAVGLTDHANMYGAYKFIDTINKHPINSNNNETVLKGSLVVSLVYVRIILIKSLGMMVFRFHSYVKIN